MARRMSAVRLYDEITERFGEYRDGDDEGDETKVTVAEFKAHLILVSFQEQRAAAERKKGQDEDRVPATETEAVVEVVPDDDDDGSDDSETTKQLG